MTEPEPSDSSGSSNENTIDFGSDGKTPPIITKESSLGPGRLYTLNGEQKVKLYQLWIMLKCYFLLPYNSMAYGKLTELGKELLSCKVLGMNVESSSSIIPETISEHPLAIELFRQAATDDLDTILLRFLRARKWSLPDVFAMLITALAWRHDFGVDAILKRGERAFKLELLKAGKAYAWEEDRKGRVVCYMRARLHDKNAQDLTESMEHVVYILEVGRRLRRYDEQLVTVVVDLKGVGLAAFDLPLVQFILGCLQSYYPEILGDCLIINAPWIFWGFWKIVKGLLDPVVASKIFFIKPEQLQDYIDPNLIPDEFGGRVAFKYYYVSPPQQRSVSNFSQDNYLRGMSELRKLECRLIDLTSELYIKVFSKSSDMTDQESTEKPDSVSLLLGERDDIKRKLRVGYYQILFPIYPLNMYHVWGVLDELGSINWGRYHPPVKDDSTNQLTYTEGRSSAPPPIDDYTRQLLSETPSDNNPP